MKKQYQFSVIIPCLNEEKTIEICIKKAKQSLLKANTSFEIIVADNGSHDKSVKIALKEGAKVIKVEEKGYGAALDKGIESANGKFIIMGDADNSYDFSDLKPFIEKLKQKNDLVVGNRFAGKIMPKAMPWQHKIIGNPALSLLSHLFFGSAIGDVYCGLRGFNKKAWMKMNLQTTGMEYAIEMVAKAYLLGMKITEVPITLYRDGRGRQSHLRTWYDGFRTLRFMLLYAPTWVFFWPGICMITVGILFFVLTVSKSFQIFGIVFDVHTLLVSSALITVGIQVLFLNIFTRIFIQKYNLSPFKKGGIIYSKYLTHTLIVGSIMVLVGSAVIARLFFYWLGIGFSNLDYSSTMRIMIPSVLLVVLGVQLFFSSFFLSLLLLPRKFR